MKKSVKRITLWHLLKKCSKKLVMPLLCTLCLLFSNQEAKAWDYNPTKNSNLKLFNELLVDLGTGEATLNMLLFHEISGADDDNLKHAVVKINGNPYFTLYCVQNYSDPGQDDKLDFWSDSEGQWYIVFNDPSLTTNNFASVKVDIGDYNYLMVFKSI